MAQENDFYERLGVDRNATADDIKKAYRKLSLKYHPDRQAGKSEEEKKAAEDKFKEINEAYEVLSNPEKKQNYDTYGDPNAQMNNPFAGGFNFGGFDFNDIFGSGPFGRTRNAAPQAQPGATLRIEIPLTMEEIYTGTTKHIKYKRHVRCATCHGSGGKTETCPHCHGTGQITKTERTPFGYSQQIMPCPHCQGTGKRIKEKCTTCNGSGFADKDNVIDVVIPSFSYHGTAFTYQGQGSESKSPNGATGDFIAIVKWVFDTDRYEIDGADVIETLEIPYEECILGTKVDVELPDHKKVRVTIPASTAPDTKLKIKNKGLTVTSYGNQTINGNYIIRVKYKIPSVLDSSEIEALETIKFVHNDLSEGDDADNISINTDENQENYVNI